MKAFILAVGDEVLCGDVLNTNASYLARELENIGYTVKAHSVIADDPEDVISEITRGISCADLIITSGGLGPTKDDLTKKAVGDALGLEMVLFEEEKIRLEEHCRRLGIVCTPNNYTQCMFPEGSKTLINENGSAPGVLIEHDGKKIAMLPGPPRELIPMFEKYLRPLIHPSEGNCFAERYYMTSGKGESEIEQLLRDSFIEEPGYTLNTYVTGSGTMIKAVAYGECEEECLSLIDKNEKKVVSLFNDIIYSNEKEEIWECVGRKLLERGLTISAAESCSGGLIAQYLTAVPGISAVFKGSCVCYMEEIKEKIVGVKHETLEKYTAVSHQTAYEMSEGIAQKFGSDIGLAVTGLAGPGGGTEEIPVGRVYTSIYYLGNNHVTQHDYKGNRERVRWKAVRDIFSDLNKMLGE